MEEIVNKVSKSSLQTIDLEEYVNREAKIVVIDLKDHLFQGMILKEKDFREFIAEEDWKKYKGTHVALTNSSEAIIPTWAYMLIASRLSGVAYRVVFGDRDKVVEDDFMEKLNRLDPEKFRDAKVVVKGCGDFHIPESCYVAITAKLSPVVSSIMYGEPCSTVPILKNRKAK